MAKAVRVAVIGGGNIGRHHMRNYASLRGVELVAVADPDADSQALTHSYGAKHYFDYRQMLEHEQLDGVSIAAPTPLHAEIAAATLNLGIATLLEKPIAVTVAEADQLLKLAKKRATTFTVGHVERYNPAVRKLRELIQEGRLGEISAILARRVGGFPDVQPQTDVIIDLAVHDIDIISFLLDEYPSSITSHGSQTLHSSSIDAAEIFLQYSKAAGFVQANWITPVKIRTLAVTGSKGYAEVNYITQKVVWYEHSAAGAKMGFDEFVASLGEPKKIITRRKLQEPLRIQLRAFTDAIKGIAGHPLVDPWDAREALRIAITALNQTKND